MARGTDIFKLDAAEQANFDRYLRSFVEDKELIVRGFVMASTARISRRSARRLLNVATEQFASSNTLLKYLDRRKYPVRDHEKFLQKCRELAKFLLQLDR